MSRSANPRPWGPRAARARRGRRRPSPLRIAAAAIVCVVALLASLVVATWLATPSTADAAERAQAVALSHGGTPIAPREIPSTLIDALLAAEDSTFYQDHGVSLEGMARAAWYDITNRCACEGGSGITQQLAEDLYLSGSDASLPRYWTDTVLALKIDLHTTKRQILAAYLSEVYLGHGAYGVVEASRIYFGKPVGQLSLTQYAMLAGLPRAPSAYDPILHPDLARERMREVLAQMVADRYITPAEARQAASGPL
jgi:membrane peptidoglycan carboxypeptidase